MCSAMAGLRKARWLEWARVVLAVSFACSTACSAPPAIGTSAAVGGAPAAVPNDTKAPSYASAGDANGFAGESSNGDSSAGGREVSPGYGVRTCLQAKPAEIDATSSCKSTGNAAFGLLLRGDILQKAQVLRGGELAIDTTGNITCSDCSCDHDPRALVIDCPDSVVSPGLINLHEHLSYANNAPFSGSERYDDRAEWRLGLRGHDKIEYAGSASGATVSAQEFRMLLSGVTSIAGGAGQPGLVRNLDVAGLSEGLFVGHIDSDTFPLADSNGVGRSGDCAYKAARMTSTAVAAQSAYLPHLAEGIDAISQNEVICSESGKFALLGPSSAVVHAVGIAAPEARALAEAHSWVVWSPRSNLSLYGNTAPITLLKHLGVGLALGSDWLLSGSMNLGRELACARALSTTAFNGAFSAFDLFRMVTTNPARAAGVGRGLGALQAGYTADVVVFAKHGRVDHSAVVQAEPADIELVLRGGRALYGDADLMRAFAGVDCETLEVCGSPKSACILGDAGLTLSALRAAGEAVYPLFSCTTPPNEPSCEPARPGEYAARSVADDRDGDAIPDSEDLCPDTFDPVRPLDHGAQADYDADGIGDACDPCPFTAGPCPSVSQGDRDDDGIDDASDDCPETANPDQLDSDGDGQGDDCDPCPAPNPGLSPCPTTIEALYESGATELPSGTAVVVRGVYVTAVRPVGPSSQGFFVQDASGLPYSGLSVYSGAVTLGVRVAERVTVRGYVSRYADAPELSEPVVEVEDDAATLPFSAIFVADPGLVADGGALAAPYRSMWLTLANVAVVSENADAPSDFDELVVSGGLRVDDALYPELDNTFPVGAQFTSLSGILGQSFSHSKLWPRSADDLSP
jgi:cytosine/adenosine deaminase-related metal-dependent hydrolase